ncbi:MAG TPA: peptidylprolyl isomerase [Vicinamibacterales bacterium]|nr:peptidylprolyl isomerase [Vicinamibacterales bacterium]
MKNVSRVVWTAVAVVSMLAVSGLKASAQDQIPTEKGPILVVETVRGTFEIKTYPKEAPKTVAHIVALTKRGFYNGLRFHRVVPGFVIQVGDPQSRDLSKRALWGTGGSGHPIGVAEFSPKLTHITGAVAMAYAGTPQSADSQFYITLAPQHSLDGKYVVFGQVIKGDDVPAKIKVGDLIKKMYVKPGTE